MRAGLLCVVAALAAGCGGSALLSPSSHADAGRSSAYGIGVDLPAGWTGRIVLGAARRPVLHAASFPLAANDDDGGEVAIETIGTADAIYLNVRNVGSGGPPLEQPVRFSASEFAPPQRGSGSRCCRVTQATTEGAVDGDRFLVTAVSGGVGGPSAAALARANDVLRTLTLGRYVQQPVAALPADAPPIDGHGISMRLPPGWHGHVGRGELDAATQGLDLKLLEHADDGGFVTGSVPIELSTTEFVPPGGGSDPQVPATTGRSFVDHGRRFVLWASADALPPSVEAVAQANEALATLTVEPGDFYPGSVEPATFASAAGWYTGTSGRAKVQPDGEQTWTWAATVPYRDEPFQFLPHKTLAALPPEGIVIDVQLVAPAPREGRSLRRPLRITPADGPGSMEGLTPPISLYGTGGRAPGRRYVVDVSVMFGRPQPTQDQLDRVDAELARIRLPDWSASAG